VSGLIIIDTDILIDAARQIGEAVDTLVQIERQSVLAVSVITRMELLVGCRNKAELRNTERFLQRFHILKLNDLMCDIAVNLLRQYRLSHGFDDPRCPDCSNSDSDEPAFHLKESTRLLLYQRVTVAAVSW
jgi:predicted nucleic acid-binding protein